MKRILQAAVHAVFVVLLAALCANGAARQDAALAVTFGMGAGFFMAFVVGYVLMYFEERAARVCKENQ
jgi:hypothetical protein